MVHTVEIDLHGTKISLETGKIAKQASGSVVVRSGDSVVLVTAVANASPKPGASFFRPSSHDGIVLALLGPFEHDHFGGRRHIAPTRP